MNLRFPVQNHFNLGWNARKHANVPYISTVGSLHVGGHRCLRQSRLETVLFILSPCLIMKLFKCFIIQKVVTRVVSLTKMKNKTWSCDMVWSVRDF